MAAKIFFLPFRLYMGLVGKVGGVIFKLGAFLGGKLFGAITRMFPALGRFLGFFTNIGSVIRGKVVAAFTWIFTQLGKLSGKFLTFGAKLGDFLFIGMKEKIVKAFTGMVGMAAGIGRGIADWLNANTPFGNQIDLGPLHFKIPELASGGTITSGGYTLVGERGPEILRLPTGAGVAPMRPARASSAVPNVGGVDGPSMAGAMFHFEIPVKVSNREIGRAVGDYVAERTART
jgi:hypothetical protein